MPGIHDLQFVAKNQFNKSKENIMDKRNHKFVNKKYKVVYENVTEEELNVLNKSYRKEEYQSFEQYIKNHIFCFSDIETDEYSADEILDDTGIGVEEHVTLQLFFEQLFDVLEPDEKEIIKLQYFEGYSLMELQKILKLDYMVIYRKRIKALKKLRSQLEKMGYHNTAEIYNK